MSDIRLAADYTAIERWEGEGGRVLAEDEELLRSGTGDLPPSGREDDAPSSAPFAAPSARERGAGSS